MASAVVWDAAVKTCQPVLRNTLAAGEQHGFSGCHLPLSRLMAVPVTEGDSVRMLLGVGGKTDDYDDADLRELQLIGKRPVADHHAPARREGAGGGRDAAEEASRAKTSFLANMATKSARR